MIRMAFVGSVCVVGLTLLQTSVAAQASASSTQQPAGSTQQPAGAASVPEGVPLPAGYVIGPEDALSVVFWREKDLSLDVIVRPDGKISLPLLNDVQAAGYTPEQLAAIVAKAAAKYVADPLASVIVRQINSRKVFVLGAVGKQGPVVLTSDMTVLQLIALVGGLSEYADKKGIVVVRQENGREKRMKFNYNEVIEGKKLEQNIKLQPGDTVLVFD